MSNQPEKDIEAARQELKQYWPTMSDRTDNSDSCPRETTLSNRSPLAYRVMKQTRDIAYTMRLTWPDTLTPSQWRAAHEVVSNGIFDAMLTAVK